MTLRIEDQARDYPKLVLGFDEAEDNIDQGTGQIKALRQMTKLSQLRKTIAKVQRGKYWQYSDCLYFFAIFKQIV
ncbi:hypothetical protein [Fastidiosipila sanguinis]|uniref:hypothetical protein n=1 Tax=Fastidiosipila sanguinis TaxID=236753 RepID=UPI001319F183|nr:hypothetical protein [Fastidiosipila sanguinis]